MIEFLGRSDYDFWSPEGSLVFQSFVKRVPDAKESAALIARFLRDWLKDDLYCCDEFINALGLNKLASPEFLPVLVDLLVRQSQPVPVKKQVSPGHRVWTWERSEWVEEVVALLGTIAGGKAAAVELLVPMLNDPEADTRQRVLGALEVLGPEAIAVLPTLKKGAKGCGLLRAGSGLVGDRGARAPVALSGGSAAP